MAKRSLCMLLAVATLFSLATPAFAEGEPAEEPIVTEESVVEATEEPVEVTDEPVEVTEEPVIETTEAPIEEAAPVEEPIPIVTEEPAEISEATEEPENADVEDEPETVDAAIAVGFCGAEGDGTNLSWGYSADGVLTISGKGKMKDYGSYGAPWSGWDLRSQIKKVVIESGVTSIGGCAFYDCRALTSITIPDSVTSIGGGAFCDCNSMTSITIPSSVTSVDDGSAFSTSSLTDIFVDSGSKSYVSVDGVLFNLDKTELVCYPQGKTATSYDIPNTVKTIGDEAFNRCRNLTSVTIPNSVTSIGITAFSYTSLTDVTIPTGVTSIGNMAFNGTPWLMAQGDFAIVNGILLKYQGSAADVTIPNGVTSIGGNAFSYCESLTSVTIPSSVTSIDMSAFWECSSLASVTIPSSVTSIGEEAFYGCDSLTSVTILSPYCDISVWYSTLGKPGTTVIHGYTGSTAEAYANRSGYTFQSIGPAPVTPTPEPTATPKPTATPTPAPAKLATPKITKMENTASGLKVTWGKVDGAVRYTVFYKLKGASKWTKIGTTTATSYTRKAKDLKSGKTYVFTIRCVKNDKKTYTSDYDKAGKSLTYYAAPTVKIAKASNGGIKVTWNKVAGASRYMVYYKENGGSWKRIGTTTATSYTRAASKLKNGVTYEFTVRCVKNDKKTMLSSYKASNSLKYKK